LTVSKQYNINNRREHNSKVVISDLEMNYSKNDGYIVKALGKNGEPHCNVDIEVIISSKDILEHQKFLLRTDV